MVSGANTPPTLDLKSLSENPPTTADELRARYDAVWWCRGFRHGRWDLYIIHVVAWVSIPIRSTVVHLRKLCQVTEVRFVGRTKRAREFSLSPSDVIYVFYQWDNDVALKDGFECFIVYMLVFIVYRYFLPHKSVVWLYSRVRRQGCLLHSCLHSWWAKCSGSKRGTKDGSAVCLYQEIRWTYL